VFGAGVGETTVSGTKAILSNIVDPNGIRMEMAELPPEASPRRWSAGDSFQRLCAAPRITVLEAAPHIPTPAALKMSREAGRAK
jgi:hypothetical protein